MVALVCTLARWAAINALCPVAALKGEAKFPTLAEGRIYDSRNATVDDHNDEAALFHVGVHSGSARFQRRGESASSAPMDGTFVLQIEIEKGAVDEIRGSPDETGFAFVESDGIVDAEIELLAAQIEHVLRLSHGPSSLFRKVVKAIVSYELTENLHIPELELRLAKRTMMLTCAVDELSLSDGDLPTLLDAFIAEVPAEGYQRKVLDTLKGHSRAETHVPPDELLHFTFEGALGGAASENLGFTEDRP